MKRILSILLVSTLVAIPTASVSVSAAENDCALQNIPGIVNGLSEIKDKLSDYFSSPDTNGTGLGNLDDCLPEKLLDCLDKLNVNLDCILPDSGPDTDGDSTDSDDCLDNDCNHEKPENGGNGSVDDDIVIEDDNNGNDTENDNIITDGYSSEVLEVVSLVNKYRAQYGLSALTYDASIMQAAQIRAREQQQLFSHTRPDGRDCFTVLAETGVSYRGAGENIAMGQRSAQSVMEAWMNSEGHRANILNSNFKKIGVGFYVGSDGTYYWSQMFIY